MTPLHIFTLLFLLSIITFTSSSTPDTITLPLSPLFAKHPSSRPFHALQLAVSTSITRARHLKNHKPNVDNNPPPLKTPVHPKSYGGYSIDLKFGTPPQTFSFVLDTGSTLVWLPCSSHYLCSKCNSFPNTTKTTPTFIPRTSSSSKFVGCRNPKCAWVFGPNVRSRCCQQNAANCSRNCPAYTVQYGLGSTAGFLLSENLNFPGKIVPDFLVGCSVVSVYQPAGIAGFGRGPESVPSQMNLTRFSYCLPSHRLDDSPASGELVLESASSGGDSKTDGVGYTPFRKNPSSKNPMFGAYYYVTLGKIVVGEKRVRVPKRLLEPDANGDGGSIVDSGSTLTFMERPIYDLVAQEFGRQVNYTRAREVERQSGLSPCFVVSGAGTASFPELGFEFRGGAKMRLPLTNYFSLVGKSDVACLTIVSDDVAGPAGAGGPAVILGNYQMQNFYVVYDLENERFGFQSQSCKTSV
ncbi:Aspartic proteinase nepenthesin-2 [Spatholobus suberectus]|nr:Aspartic proteinase nepenthesin-2 [Spatholobus suberectus]